MSPQQGEERDVPFLKNDMKGGPRTTGKPLDTSDEPGRADAETGAEQQPLPPGPPSGKMIDADDASIDDPKDDAFRTR